MQTTVERFDTRATESFESLNDQNSVKILSELRICSQNTLENSNSQFFPIGNKINQSPEIAFDLSKILKAISGDRFI